MESPLAVVRLMSPAGILTASPGMMWRSNTEIYPQCNVGVVIGPPCARSSGFCRRLVRLLLSNLLKALTVGANTVKGGSRLVSLPKAVSRASRRVENLLSVARTCPVVGSEEPRHYTLSAPGLPPYHYPSPSWPGDGGSSAVACHWDSYHHWPRHGNPRHGTPAR